MKETKKKEILFIFLIASGFLSNSLFIFGFQDIISRLFSLLFITGTLCWMNCKISKNIFYIYLSIFMVNFIIVITNAFFYGNTYLFNTIVAGLYKLIELFCVLVYAHNLLQKDVSKLINSYLLFFYLVSVPSFLFYLACQFELYTGFTPRYIVYFSETATLRFGSLSGEPSFYIFFCIIAWYFVDIKKGEVKTKWLEKMLLFLLVYSTYSTLSYLLFALYYIVKYRKISWILFPILLIFLVNGIQFARLNISLEQLLYFIVNMDSIDPIFYANNSLLVRLYPTFNILTDILNHPWGYGLLGYKSVKVENFENIMIGGPGILQFIRDIGLPGFGFICILFFNQFKKQKSLILVICVFYISLQDTYLLTSAWFFIISHKLWKNHHQQLYYPQNKIYFNSVS